MNETIYGIHVGCVYEGGESKRVFYKKYEDAKEEALKEVQKEIERQNRVYPTKKDKKLWGIKEWRETKKDYWTNKLDCVIVVKCELK